MDFRFALRDNRTIKKRSEVFIGFGRGNYMFTAVLDIFIGIYAFYISVNMIQMKGRQKKQILKEIPDENKAAMYGRQAGMAFLLFAVGLIVLNVLFILLKATVLTHITEYFILAFAGIILYLNKKWSGKYGILIW